MCSTGQDFLTQWDGLMTVLTVFKQIHKLIIAYEMKPADSITVCYWRHNVTEAHTPQGLGPHHGLYKLPFVNFKFITTA